MYVESFLEYVLQYWMQLLAADCWFWWHHVTDITASVIPYDNPVSDFDSEIFSEFYNVSHHEDGTPIKGAELKKNRLEFNVEYGTTTNTLVRGALHTN